MRVPDVLRRHGSPPWWSSEVLSAANLLSVLQPRQVLPLASTYSPSLTVLGHWLMPSTGYI